MTEHETTAFLTGGGREVGSVTGNETVGKTEVANPGVEARPKDMGEGWFSNGARCWLIANPRRGEPNMLVLGPFGGERILPVFSSEEEAAAFLFAHGPSPEGWRVEEARIGRLLSELTGPPLAGVETVVLDPIPGVPIDVSAALVGVDKGHFKDHLFERLEGHGGTREVPPSSRNGRR